MKDGNGVRFSERKIFGVRRLGAAFVLDGLPSRPFYFSIKLRLTIKAILFIKKARVPLTLPSRTPKYLTRRCGGAEDVREVLKISLRSLRLKIIDIWVRINNRR